MSERQRIIDPLPQVGEDQILVTLKSSSKTAFDLYRGMHLIVQKLDKI